MSYWLKSLGTGEQHLPRLWAAQRKKSDALEGFATPSSKRPSFEVGDRVVYYAAGWQSIFGVVEVAEEPVFDPTWKEWQGDRWGWVVKVDPLIVIPDLERAPHVGMAAVDTLSVRNQSHIRLTPSQYWHALMSIAGVAGIASNGDRGVE